MSTGSGELREALARGGCAEVGPLLVRLDRAFATPADHEEDVREVLGLLKSHRCFTALDELTTALAKRASGSLGIFIRRQQAQAKVDCGRLDEALAVLSALAGDVRGGGRKDRSEVAGLLGRVHKQRFVNATENSEDGSAALREAIASHSSVFDLDPSWHGANIIALSARAERDGIGIETGPAELWASRLLQELNDAGRASWGAWDFAAAGEAWLALGDPERSAASFRDYWSSPNVDAFALGGTARQLREIWQAGSREDPFLSSLLVQVEARLLGRAGGRVEWSSDDLITRVAGIGRQLQDHARAEALFGADSTLQLQKLLTLIRRAGAVCRVFDPQRSKSGGTGFLVDGALFGAGSSAPLLLTNHHVLYGPEITEELLALPEYRGAVPLGRAKAQFTYWDCSSERTFDLQAILSYSPRNEIDFTLASLAGEVPPGVALPICVDARPLASRNILDPAQRSKVLIIGHPRGEALTFSLSDNEVVDHELDGNPCPSPRRIHYRTTTDRGNSGSPVLEFETLDVVGLHRSGRVPPLRDEWPRKGSRDVYQANEAVWIGSVRGAP